MSLLRQARSLAHRNLWESGEESERILEARSAATQILRGQRASHAERITASLSGVKSVNADSVIFQAPPLASLPALPPGYGFKGGAARAALAALLPGSTVIDPRDIDLVRIRGSKADGRDDERLSRQFMPGDFARGAGVEVVASGSAYFKNRDLTVNEVFAVDSEIHVSLLGLLDTLGRMFRPAKFRPGTLHAKPRPLGRTLLKIMRLRAELLLAGEAWSAAGFPEEFEVRDEEYARELGRAFERSEDCARLFVEQGIELGLEPAGDEYALDPLTRAVRTFAHFAIGENALIEHLPERWRREVEEIISVER